MPREAVAMGGTRQVLPIHAISAALIDLVRKKEKVNHEFTRRSGN
jgi:chemotaxis response regulator CheB